MFSPDKEEIKLKKLSPVEMDPELVKQVAFNMYSPGQRIKQIPFSMYSPEQLCESPGPECSFDISSPEADDQAGFPKAHLDSQDETDDLYNFDYVTAKQNVVFLNKVAL
jgi:hypothetical protein